MFSVVLWIVVIIGFEYFLICLNVICLSCVNFVVCFVLVIDVNFLIFVFVEKKCFLLWIIIIWMLLFFFIWLINLVMLCIICEDIVFVGVLFNVVIVIWFLIFIDRNFNMIFFIIDDNYKL